MRITVQLDRRKTSWRIKNNGNQVFCTPEHNGSKESGRLQCQRHLAQVLQPLFDSSHAERPHFLAARMVAMTEEFGVSISVERAELPDPAIVT